MASRLHLKPLFKYTDPAVSEILDSPLNFQDFVGVVHRQVYIKRVLNHIRPNRVSIIITSNIMVGNFIILVLL